MKKYEASSTIQASPEQIWNILVEQNAYPEWDPNMLRVEGNIKLGEKVKFFTKLSPERAFPAKVTAFEPGKRMVLTGGMPLGLFKSERVHTLTAVSDTETQFHTQETFSGLLLPVFGKSIPDLTDIFNEFAQGLKKRAEA